ncbi:MAG: hypothetical protein ACLFV3_01625 [Phycisphaeraceae bacterium]
MTIAKRQWLAALLCLTLSAGLAAGAVMETPMPDGSAGPVKVARPVAPLSLDLDKRAEPAPRPLELPAPPAKDAGVRIGLPPHHEFERTIVEDEAVAPPMYSELVATLPEPPIPSPASAAVAMGMASLLVIHRPRRLAYQTA